tara:strand:+ start:325 stop:492 length:168 start_codon:yes stop_codon:yes gene_type:complete
MLVDNIKKLEIKKSWNTASGTVFRIFEIYEKDGLNYEGKPYVFIRPEIENKKKRI